MMLVDVYDKDGKQHEGKFGGFTFERSFFGLDVGIYLFSPTDRKSESACTICKGTKALTLGTIGIKPYVAIEYAGDIQH